MAFDHLAGCDLHHTRRQSCRSSTAGIPTQESAAADAEMRPSIPLPKARIGCGSFVLAALMLPIFLGAASIADCVALDRLGWVDFGEPNYIRESKPSFAHLVAKYRCCGGASGGGTVTQFFYGTDTPFEDVVAHYRAEMAKRGYASGVSRDPDWLSKEQEVWFDKLGSFDGRSFTICFSITPFSAKYDLEQGLWDRYQDESAQELRRERSKYAHPYVAEYVGSYCGG